MQGENNIDSIESPYSMGALWGEANLGAAPPLAEPGGARSRWKGVWVLHIVQLGTLHNANLAKFLCYN